MKTIRSAILLSYLMLSLNPSFAQEGPSIPAPGKTAPAVVTQPKISTITLHWTHMQRSKNKVFYKKDEVVKGTFPGFYAVAQVCTTFRRITRCQQVAKTSLPYEPGNNTSRGDFREGGDPGGAYSDRGEKTINVEALTIDKNQARRAAEDNQREILAEIKKRFLKQNPKATTFDIEEHLTLALQGDNSTPGLAEQAPSVQLSVIHFRDDTWPNGNEHWPAGNLIIPLSELVGKVGQPAYEAFIPDGRTAEGMAQTPVRVGDEYPAWSGGRVWGKVRVQVHGEVQRIPSGEGSTGLPRPEIEGETPAVTPKRKPRNPVDEAFAHIPASEQPESINGLAYESDDLRKILPEDLIQEREKQRPASRVQAI